MTADLSALIDRLEAAEVGSRELGRDVLLALGWHREQIGNFYGPLYQWSSPDRSSHLIRGDEDTLPNPVLSLDAALALAERLYPHHAKTTTGNDASGFVAFLIPRGGRPIGAQKTFASPALAMCIAILRAKQGEGE